MQTLEFKIKLQSNHYTNWNSVHICLPIQIKKSTNEANDIDAAMIQQFMPIGLRKWILNDKEMT